MSEGDTAAPPISAPVTAPAPAPAAPAPAPSKPPSVRDLEEAPAAGMNVAKTMTLMEQSEASLIENAMEKAEKAADTLATKEMAADVWRGARTAQQQGVAQPHATKPDLQR